MPKVTVIIPVYGVERYISKCARSLFEQTLDDIEYIFINDCSPDKSIDLLKIIINEYPQRKDSVIIYNMSKNSGQAAVRKRGIELSTGDYIIHCDSDDWVEPNMYQLLWESANLGNYDIVFCDFYNTTGKQHFKVSRDFGDLNKEKILSTIIKNSLWSLCCALVRGSILRTNKINYPISNQCEDLALMVQMVYYSQRIYHISEPLYYYYYNTNSISRNQSVESSLKRLNDHINNVKLIEEFFKINKVLEHFSDEVLLLKLNCRLNIADYTSQKMYRKMWYSIFPELDTKDILFNKGIPLNKRLKYLAVRIYLFSFLKKICNIILKRF